MVILVSKYIKHIGRKGCNWSYSIQLILQSSYLFVLIQFNLVTVLFLGSTKEYGNPIYQNSDKCMIHICRE